MKQPTGYDSSCETVEDSTKCLLILFFLIKVIRKLINLNNPLFYGQEYIGTTKPRVLTLDYKNVKNIAS